jgi:metallo-beta-lactamase class B
MVTVLPPTPKASSASRAVSPSPSLRIELADGLHLRQIGQGVFVVTHAFPWPANSLLVEMADSSLLLAGTPYTADATRSLLQWARQQFGYRRLVAIDTGYHVDNLGGNQALLEAGVAVYGSDLTVKLLQERGEETRRVTLAMIGDATSPFYAVLQEQVFFEPDHVFPVAEGLGLRFGHESVRVYYPGPSQAPDKVVVYFPERRLLFGSCLILAGEKPGNTADADLENWPNAVRKLQRFAVEVVVPGHGDRLDPGLVEHTLQVLASYRPER